MRKVCNFKLTEKSTLRAQSGTLRFLQVTQEAGLVLLGGTVKAIIGPGLRARTRRGIRSITDTAS